MKRRGKQSIALPWEDQSAWSAGIFGGSRWRISLGIALLLAGLAMIVRSSIADHQIRRTRAQIAETRAAVTTFRAQLGRCPSSLTELVHPPRSVTRFLRSIPKDAWGRPLFVRCPGRFEPSDSDVISAGPSGVFWTDDNVY